MKLVYVTLSIMTVPKGQTHWLITWQPRLETNQADGCHQQSYLVCPPHHQVRENCDPSDGAEERDREELLGSLRDNQRETRQSCPLCWRESPKLQLPLPLPWFLSHLLLGCISNQKMLLAPNQTGRGKCILGNLNWWELNGCRTGKEISLSSFSCLFFLPFPPLLSLRQCLIAQDSLDGPELLMQPRLVSNPIFLFQPPNCCDMDHRIGLWKSLERMFIPVARRAMPPAPVFYRVWILCHSFC